MFNSYKRYILRLERDHRMKILIRNEYQLQQLEFSERKVLEYLKRSGLPYFNEIRREIGMGTAPLRKALIRLMLKRQIIPINLGRKYKSYLFFLRKEEEWMFNLIDQRMGRKQRIESRKRGIDLEGLTLMLCKTVSKSKRSVCKEHNISVSQFDRLVEYYPYLKEIKNGLGL